jgi:hypothetical protein
MRNATDEKCSGEASYLVFYVSHSYPASRLIKNLNSAGSLQNQ